MKTTELTTAQMNAIQEVAAMRGTFEQQVAETILRTGNITLDQSRIINPCLDEEIRIDVPLCDISFSNFHSASSMRQRGSSLR